MNVRNLADNTRVLTLALGCVAMAMGCGGSTNAGDKTTPNPADAPKAPKTTDLSYQYAAVQLTGTTFAPRAINGPSVVQIKIPGRAPKASRLRRKLRRMLTNKDVHYLVQLLVVDAAKQDALRTPAGAQAALTARTEARDWLVKLAESESENPKEITLKRLAALQFAVSEADAVPYYVQLVQGFPDSPSVLEYKTWLAYAYLHQRRVDDAAQLVGDWIIDQLDAPAAYVLAWTRFLMRDGDAAEAIAATADKWRGNGRPALLKDAKLILARSGALVDQAMSVLRTILPPDRPALLTFHGFKLHEAYVAAGRYDLAVATLDALFDAASESDKVQFRYHQSGYLYRVNRPAEAASRVQAAYDLCVAWDECTDKLRNLVAEQMLTLASVFHRTYATSLNKKYSSAAKALYQKYLSMSPAPDNQEMAQTHADNLAEHVKNSSPEMSRHDKDLMGLVVQARSTHVSACYEGVLQTEPDLAGTVAVTIDVSEQGEVTGVAVDPAAGDSGLAAVAACLDTAVRSWSYPTRIALGTTKLVQPFVFQPKSEPQQ